MALSCKISGTGLFVPKKVVTNKDLEKIVDTSDEWIFERTGIKERRLADWKNGETPSEMASKSSLMAIKNANLKVDDIDFIIFASTSGDYKLPNSASLLQQKLGITNQCPAIDIAAACTGFVYGLTLAEGLIQTRMAKNILVVGSEVMTNQIDWTDRTMCVLFGDGSGAAVISATEDESLTGSRLLAHTLMGDGSGKEAFCHLLGASAHPITAENVDHPDRFMRMKGKEVFKFAVKALEDSVLKVLKKADLTLNDVTWIVPHQANARIIEAAAKRLDLDLSKFIINIHEAVENQKIKRGDIVLLVAFGAGLSAGATLFRY